MNDSWLLDQLLSVFYVGHDGDLYYSLKDHIGLADQLPKAFDFLVERKAEQDDHDDHDDWINATSDWG